MEKQNHRDQPMSDNVDDGQEPSEKKKIPIPILVALITLVGILGAALIAIIPDLISGKQSQTSGSKTEVNVGNSENTFGTVNGDVIINPQHPSITGESEGASSPSKIDSDRVLSKDLSPRDIMDSLYAKDSPREREYAAYNYKKKILPDNGWEAVVSEISTPTAGGGDKIVAYSNDVKLYIYSENSLRHISKLDKINVTGHIGTVTAKHKNPFRDNISIHNAKVLQIGRGVLKPRCDFEEVNSQSRQYISSSYDIVADDIENEAGRDLKKFSDKYMGKWVRITAKFEFRKTHGNFRLAANYQCTDFDYITLFTDGEAQFNFLKELNPEATVTVDAQLTELNEQGFTLENIEFP